MTATTQSFRPTLADRIMAVLHSVAEARAQRAAYERAVTELSSLSDRELDDLGISRFQIRGYAAGTLIRNG